MKHKHIKTIKVPFSYRKYHFIMKTIYTEIWEEKFSVVEKTGCGISNSCIFQHSILNNDVFNEAVNILEQIRERKLNGK